MKRFFIGLGAGFFVTPLLLLALALGLPTEKVGPARWVGDCLKVKLAVAREEAKPQIIILSGSNALYGFSARSMRERADLRAVNLGMHAGLGLKYTLYYGLSVAKKGDLFVLPFEYEFYEPERYEGALSLQILANDPAFFGKLSPPEQFKLIASITASEWIAFVRNRTRPDPVEGAGCRPESLTKYGDQTANQRAGLDKKAHALLAARPARVFSLSAEAKENILWFKRELAKVGASFVLAYPNTLEPIFNVEENKAFLSDLDAFAAAEGIVIIGRPEDRAFSLDQAFDTNYHVDSVRQEENTTILLKQLGGIDLRPFQGAIEEQKDQR
ncbi:MAG: hypothetical protein WC612_08605 [Bdellovibrionales bacterium]|jgi:hypothetical protein